MTHGHELRGVGCWRKGGTGQREAKGGNRDNCNSIINKIYFKKDNDGAGCDCDPVWKSALIKNRCSRCLTNTETQIRTFPDTLIRKQFSELEE